MWTAKLVFLWVFAVAAAYYDLRYRRVPNLLILCAAAGGIALAAAGGWSAFCTGLSGMALGFSLLLPAFLARMVGGGDVKSLAVIGLAVGPGLLWVSFLRGVVAGGLAGALLLASKWLMCRGKGEVDCREAPVRTLPYAGILSLCAAISALFF